MNDTAPAAPIRFSVDLPPDLNERLTALADREKRSRRAQGLVLIEQGLEAAERLDAARRDEAAA